MSDPTRLLHGPQISATSARLLRSLRAPTPAPPAVNAALAQHLGGLVAHGGPAAVAAVSWLKLGLVSLAVAGSGVAAWKVASPAPTISPAPQVAPARAVPLPAPTPVVVPSALAEPLVERAMEPARPSAAPSASAEPRDKLAEEEALLEQARSLVGQTPWRALGLLRQHQARYAGGQLAAERMYLSVDCLRRLGRSSEAKRESDALIARYPNSAYARRAPLLLAPPAR